MAIYNVFMNNEIYQMLPNFDKRKSGPYLCHFRIIPVLGKRKSQPYLSINICKIQFQFIHSISCENYIICFLIREKKIIAY